MSHTANENSRAYERGEISYQQLGEALRRGWKIILAATLLGALLGWGASAALGKSYTSSASGVVVSTGGPDATEALAGENLAKSKAVTFGSISGTSSTATEVIDKLNLQETPEALLQRVETTVPLDTSEVRVTATADTPEQAQRLAETWIDVLGSHVGGLGGSSNNSKVSVELTAVGEASAPRAPSSPSPAVLIVAGALLGLLGGALFTIVRHQLQNH